MPSKKMARTTYRDPNLPGNPVRSGDTTHGESAVDMDQYHLALEQVHGTGVHGWGVAAGLRVTAKVNTQGLNVLPGVALDVAGRHISLADTGQAEIGQNADAPNAAPTLAGVAAAGAVIPTAGLNGDKYVTIQFWETFDSDGYNLYGIYRFNHTPWLRLLPVAGYLDDGNRIVLARVALDGAGNVVGLTAELRRGTDVPAQSVHLTRGVVAAPAPDFAVDAAPAGLLQARAQGGLELRVPNVTDEIDIERPGGNFAKLSIGAQQIVARRSDGRESVVIDTQLGNITAGTHGVEGDILVKDAANRLTVALDGDDAALALGTRGLRGKLRVMDNEGANSVVIDGQPGDITFRGRLRDPNLAHNGIGHDRLRHLPELTSQGFTTLHRHNIGTVGLFGATSARVGVISGQVAVHGSGRRTGGVRLTFAGLGFSNGSGGFRGDFSGANGFSASYSATPHVMAAPTVFNLTTGYVFTSISTNITSSRVDFAWDINGGDDSWQAFGFIVIGPIA